MQRVYLGKSQNTFLPAPNVTGQMGLLCKTVSSRDAAVERTGTYLPRVLHNNPICPVTADH